MEAKPPARKVAYPFAYSCLAVFRVAEGVNVFRKRGKRDHADYCPTRQEVTIWALEK
jgi:hypothetical protein